MADQRARWPLIERLFHQTLERPEAERVAFLREHAGGDDSLVREVEALLDADRRSHTLLDAPVPGSLPAGLRVGPYAIERILGSGGMATVYLARRADRQFDKLVAIKLVHQGLAAALGGGRFETERQVLARLEHPHIARLLDSGTNEFGQPYLVMEWVDGVTLDAWLASERPALDRALDLWLELAGAVAYAHRNLVIHRDIKPSNVLVAADGSAKLVDFGIAKLVEQSGMDVQTRTTLFTPRYASPEQLSGGTATTATDVFGLGLLLCEQVAGVHPFHRAGPLPQDQMAAVLADEPDVPARVPADLAAIIRMALRKEPERRYASVEAFAEDVRRYRRGLPVVAQPETSLYKARKFASRHRAGVAVAAVAVLAVGAAAVLFARQARITAVERDRANLEAQKATQVNRFLQNMLSAADPTREGRDVRVADLLDRASGRLAAELRGQPQVEAELRATLASTYQGLGLFDKALAQARQSLALREATRPADDPDVARALIGLGNALFEHGDFSEAEAPLRRGLAILERKGLGGTMDAADGRRYLGGVLNDVGRYEEAERSYREAIAAYRRLLPQDDEHVGRALDDLAVSFDNRQQFARAEPLHREALAIMKRVRGPEHLEVAQTAHNLATALDAMSRFVEAEALYREALAIQLKLLGENHSKVVLTRSSLADSFWIRKDYRNAEVFARAALASAERGLPPGHPLTAYAHIEVGQTLTDAGRPAEGEPHLRKALEMRRKLLPAGHWLLANSQSVLGGCVLAQRRFDEAEALLLPSYKRLLEDRGPANEKTRDARRRLAMLYRAWGRPQEATPYERDDAGGA
jgi:eukaryotic-like serine/threonine-protein kinase